METWMVVTAATLGLVSTPVCAFFLLFHCFPHYLIRLSFRIREFTVGMRIKYVGDENMVFCYGEKNSPRPDKASIVFVHGFTSSKDQWISNFKGLPKDLHLIAVDLPGHGASTIPPEHVKLGLDFVVQSLNKFLDLAGLSDKKVHLVGSSLGGAIVGLFAAHHPERVDRVTMVCPAMQTPVQSEFAIQIREAIAVGPENITTANCKLLPTDIPGVKAMFDACCFNKELGKFSDKIWKGVLHLRLPKTDFYLRLFKSITSTENMNLLERTAPRITVPSQLIWGKQDELIHVSGAELLRSKLPNCRRVDLIDNCGHAIDLDRPGAFNKYLLLFIQNGVTTEGVEQKNK